MVGAAFAGLGGRSLGEFAFRVAQRKMARPELTAQRFDEVMTSDATPEQKQQIYLEARALFADARKREALEKSDPTRYAELKIRVEKETIRQFQAMLSAVQEKNDSLGRHVESGVQIAAVRNKIEEITSGTRAAKHAEQKRATKEQATRVATQLAIGAAVSAATWYLTPAIRQFAREKITDAARFIVEHSGSAHAAGGAAIAVPSIEGGKNIHPQTPPATLREGPVSDKPITNSQLDHVHETTRFDQAVQDDDVGVGEVPVDESPAVIPLKVVATESTDVHSEPNVTTTWAGIKQEYEEGESTAQLPSTASPEQTSDLKPDFGAPPAVTETQGGTNGDHPATPTQQDVEQPSPLSKVPANIEYNGATGTYDSAHGYYTVEDKLVALSGTGEQRELEKLGGRLGWFKSDGATGSHKIAKDGYTAFLAYDGENKLYILVGEQIKGDVWTQHAVQFKDGAVLIDGNTTTPAVIEMPIEPTTLSSSVAPELPSHTPSEVISVLNDIDKNNYWSVDVEKVIAEFNLEEALKQQVEREVKFERAYIDNLISEMARYKKEYGKRQNWSAFEQEVVSNKKYIEHAQSRLSDLIDHAVAGEADKITPGGFARITGNPEKVGQDTARMTLEALAKQVKLTTRQESMTDAFADLDTNEASASSAPPSLGGSAPPEEPELSDLPSNPDSIEGQGKIERITFHEGHVQFTQGRNEGELSVSVEIKLVGFRPPDYYGKDINGIDLSKITELQHTLRVMKSYTEGYRQYSAQHGGVVDDAHKQAFIDALTFNARSYNKDGKTIINIDKFLSEMEVPIKPSAATSPPVEIGSPPVDTETSDTGTEDFVPEIKLTQQESQKLSSFMNGLDERISKLVNNKEFMGSAMAKELDVIVEKKWLPLVKNGNDYIFSTKNGAQYQVVESPWYHDQYPQGKKPETNDLIFMKKGAEDTEFFSVPYNKIVQEMQNAQAEREPLSGRVEKLIVEMARQAHQNFVEQEQTAPTLQKFDLPKDKPIGFLSIIPSESELKSDLITSGVVEQSKHMPLLLKQRGYDIKIPQGQENGLIDSGANAVATISNSVEALHATGTRDFYLDLVGHGDKTGIYFGASDSAPHVDTENLLRLVQQYPDSRFYISTVACDGGGIREQLMPLLNTPDVHDRIDVFLQAKPSEINQEGRIQDGTATPEPYSSYYNMLLMKHLNEKLPDGGYRTFGDAVYQTDKEGQKYISVNPESIVDGTLMKGITQPLRSK
ncbi:MAG: hypothetical protein A3B94_02780 [Candidatus Jacksonbacteria bacterium RIFCSPHIGHO2_02_FULL_43_10]|nr:MAG: hypothetical protein A3B94_02780 [Candidatus Jacksonbacteria bacterium RIFCSPHIGHO2_02_FULL_43_10]